MSFHRGKLIRSIIEELYVGEDGFFLPEDRMYRAWLEAVNALVDDIQFKVQQDGGVKVRIETPEGEQIVTVQDARKLLNGHTKILWSTDRENPQKSANSDVYNDTLDPHDFIDFVR